MSRNADWFGPLGQLVAIVTTFVIGTAVVLERMHRMDKRLMTIEFGVRDRWTSQDQINWSDALRARNAGLEVPRPQEFLLREREN